MGTAPQDQLGMSLAKVRKCLRAAWKAKGSFLRDDKMLSRWLPVSAVHRCHLGTQLFLSFSFQSTFITTARVIFLTMSAPVNLSSRPPVMCSGTCASWGTSPSSFISNQGRTQGENLLFFLYSLVLITLWYIDTLLNIIFINDSS